VEVHIKHKVLKGFLFVESVPDGRKQISLWHSLISFTIIHVPRLRLVYKMMASLHKVRLPYFLAP